LDRTWAKDIPLIYSRKVNPDAVATYPGPTLPIWMAGGIGTFMPGDQELVLNGGGSVGVALTRLLDWCAVEHIVLAGFDFGWQGSKTHVPGHLAEKKPFCHDSTRHVAMKNKWGDTVYTDGAYLTALRDLEKDLTGTLKTRVSNLYGGGIRIQGAPEVRFQQIQREKFFSSQKKDLNQFLRLLNAAQGPRSWPRIESRSSQWAHSIRAVEKKLERLCRLNSSPQHEIKAVLGQIVIFLKQDPLYKPYLFNEILDMTCMVRKKEVFNRKTLTHCKEILKRVLEKVTEIDRFLVYERKEAA
jgi:hypothetical protein